MSKQTANWLPVRSANNSGTEDSDNSSFEAAIQPENFPRIAELFKGKSVLVTGATGFIGKVLVEKLLRSCPGIAELFILIRPSKTGDVEVRLEEYKTHRIFVRLRQEQPDALNKLRALSGDITTENLGLTGWRYLKVITDVSFVFHCAANVRFDEKVRDVLGPNLLGVQNVLNLCKDCKQLKALVHVSTAYSFCNHSVISEQVYPELAIPEAVIKGLGWMTEDQLYMVCLHYLQNRPSLYPFSKALAETLLVESDHVVPVIIVRPSVVTASMNEPYAGWIDNYNGPSGFIALSGKGVIRTLLVDPNVNADWIPVDILVNTLIVAAHYMAVKSKSAVPPAKLKGKNNVPIINCTCAEENTITWMEVVNICLPLLVKYPSMQVFRKPGGTVTPSPFIHYSCCLFNHYVPAFLIDGVSCLMWKKPKLVCFFNRIHRVLSYLEYYTTHSFEFRSQNMRKLVEQMEPKDREVFPIDQRVLDWKVYLESYVLGVRRYFMLEKDDTLPEARKRMMRIHYVWLVVKLSSMAGMVVFIRSVYRSRFLQGSLLPSFPSLALTMNFGRKSI